MSCKDEIIKNVWFVKVVLFKEIKEIKPLLGID
jgi:hypothetical protein